MRDLKNVDVEDTKTASEKSGLERSSLRPLIRPERSLVNSSTYKEAINHLMSLVKLANKWKSKMITGRVKISTCCQTLLLEMLVCTKDKNLTSIRTGYEKQACKYS